MNIFQVVKLGINSRDHGSNMASFAKEYMFLFGGNFMPGTEIF